jgi:BlaI family penicillinase repressor
MARKRRIVLTKLEGEIMRAVWDRHPDQVRVRDIVEAVNARRSTPLAYNTVQTMLTILRDKGVVQVVADRGRAHFYRAKVSHDEISRSMVGELVDRLFNGRVQPLLHQLIEQADLSPSELTALRSWVDAKLRDAGEDER